MKNTDLKRKLRVYSYINIISCSFLMIAAIVILLKMNTQKEIDDTKAGFTVYESYFRTLEKVQASHMVNVPDIINDYKSFPFLWKNTPDVQNTENFDEIDKIIQNINTDIQVLKQDSLFAERIGVIIAKYESIMPYVVSDVFTKEIADIESDDFRNNSINVLLLIAISIVTAIISLLSMKHNSESITAPVYELIDSLEALNEYETVPDNPVNVAYGYEFGTIADLINKLVLSLRDNVCSSAEKLSEYFRNGKASMQELQIDYDKLSEYQKINEKMKQLIFDLRNTGTKFNLEFSGDELVDKFTEIKTSFIEYHDFMKKEYNKAIDRDKSVTSFMCSVLADLKDTAKRNSELLDKDTNLVDIKPLLLDIGNETARIKSLGESVSGIESELNNFTKMRNKVSDFAEELLMIAINISISGASQGSSTQIRKIAEDLKKLSGMMNEICIQSETSQKNLSRQTEHISQSIKSSEQMIEDKLRALDSINTDLKSKARIVSDILTKQNSTVNDLSQIINHISSHLESNIYLPASEKIKERFNSMNSLINDVPIDEGNLNDLTADIENKISGIQTVSTRANTLLIDILNEYSDAVKKLNEKISRINDEYDRIEIGLVNKDQNGNNTDS